MSRYSKKDLLKNFVLGISSVILIFLTYLFLSKLFVYILILGMAIFFIFFLPTKNYNKFLYLIPLIAAITPPIASEINEKYIIPKPIIEVGISHFKYEPKFSDVENSCGMLFLLSGKGYQHFICSSIIMGTGSFDSIFGTDEFNVCQDCSSYRIRVINKGKGLAKDIQLEGVFSNDDFKFFENDPKITLKKGRRGVGGFNSFFGEINSLDYNEEVVFSIISEDSKNISINCKFEGGKENCHKNFVDYFLINASVPYFVYSKKSESKTYQIKVPQFQMNSELKVFRFNRDKLQFEDANSTYMSEITYSSVTPSSPPSPSP